MRRILVLTAALSIVLVPAAFAKAAFPETIALPNGFQPRGSRSAGHDVLRRLDPDRRGLPGDLRTGKGAPLVPRQRGTGRDRDRGRPGPALRRRRPDGQGVRLRREDRARSCATYQLATGGARRSSTTSSSTSAPRGSPTRQRAVLYRVPLGARRPGDRARRRSR